MRHRPLTDEVTLKAMEHSVDLNFRYNVGVVACIKTLHPKRRCYDGKGKWTIDVRCLREFIDRLHEEFPEKISLDETLTTLLLELKDRLPQEETDDFVEPIPAPPPNIEPQPSHKRQISDDEVIDLTQKIEPPRPSSVLPPLVVPALPFPVPKFEPKKVKGVRQVQRPSDCDCGRPEHLVDGVHHCRYYGTFQCTGST